MSFQARYPGGSGWKAWTPTVTSETGTLTSASGTGTWSEVGAGVIQYHATLTITTAGTGAGGLFFTTPTNIHADTSNLGSGMEANSALVQCLVFRQSPTVGSVRKYDFTTIIANGRTVWVSGTYKRG